MLLQSHNSMFQWCAGTSLVGVFVLASMANSIAQPTPGHRCVANCGSPAGPQGGYYNAPAPSGPSAEEIAAQQRRAAALAANDKGLAAFNRRDFREAERYFLEAVKLAPNDNVIRGNLKNTSGLIAYEKGDYEWAIGYFREALRLQPNNQNILKNLNEAQASAANDQGVQAFQRGDYNAAVAFYREALRYSPNDSVIQDNLNLALKDARQQKQGQTEAEALLRQEETRQRQAEVERRRQESALRAKEEERRVRTEAQRREEEERQRQANEQQRKQEAALRAKEEELRTREAELRAREEALKSPRLPTVSPSMFITQAEYKSAHDNLARLQKQQDGLTAQLAKVKEWEKGLQRDDKEFEQMRKDAQKDYGWEVLAHFPAGELFDALKGNPALKNLDIDKIKAAYEAVKGLLETGHGISANDRQEKIHAILEGNRAIREAMIEGMISAPGLDERSKKVLDVASKCISTGATLATSEGSDKLKTLMAVVETLAPLESVRRL